MQIEADHLYLAELSSGLQDRVILAPYPPSVRFCQIVLVQTGTLELVEDGTGAAAHLAAPGLVCQPSGALRRMRLRAGSAGLHLAATEAGIAAALGGQPEAAELRVMLREPIVLPLQDSPVRRDQIGHAVRSLAQEMDAQERGHLTVVDAQLRCLLVHLWRSGFGAVGTGMREGVQTVLLRQFRQLVETQFRKRWRVAQYAGALGTSPDRLHAVATRVLGRAPLALIHERTMREARALLARSSLTLDQVAADLGFAGSAQFSAFFKAREGLSPGRYRARALAAQAGGQGAEEVNFPDWP